MIIIKRQTIQGSSLDGLNAWRTDTQEDMTEKGSINTRSKCL